MHSLTRLLLLMMLQGFAMTLHAQTILVFGDSLSAAYSIPKETAWVHLLQTRLSTQHYATTIINTSVSGETTDGGLRRLPPLLATYQPDIVLLELGANDGLRGFPLTVPQANLQQMIDLCHKANAKVLLIGIRLPPNYGKRYTDGFTEMYTALAKQNNLPLLPFLLNNVAVNPELMHGDGIHPNAKAQPILLDNVWPYLMPMLTPPVLKR